jgi:hypothetical protein
MKIQEMRTTGLSVRPSRPFVVAASLAVAMVASGRGLSADEAAPRQFTIEIEAARQAEQGAAMPVGFVVLPRPEPGEAEGDFEFRVSASFAGQPLAVVAVGSHEFAAQYFAADRGPHVLAATLLKARLATLDGLRRALAAIESRIDQDLARIAALQTQFDDPTTPAERRRGLEAQIEGARIALAEQERAAERIRASIDASFQVEDTATIEVVVEPVRVGFSVTGFDSVTGAPATAVVAVEVAQLDPDAHFVADFSVTVELPPELAARFDSAEPFFLQMSPDVPPWTLSSTLSGNLLTLTVSGLANPEYVGIRSLGPRGEIATIRFNTPLPGTYTVRPADAQVVLPEADPRIVQIEFQPGTFEVGAPRIKTIELPTAHAGKPYRHELAYMGLAWPVEFALIAGTLPPGYQVVRDFIVAEWGRPGQAGSYAFTLVATDASGVQVSADLTLTVEPAGPRLTRATLIEDSDGDGAVSEGDVLLLWFDEPVELGANSIEAIDLGFAGDALGTGAVVELDHEFQSRVRVRLGSGVRLTVISGTSSDNVSITARSVSSGITDLDGISVSDTTPIRLGVLLTPSVGEGPWIAGASIAPIRLTPFHDIPTGISVENLPAGVTLDGGFIRGTPALSAVEAKQDGVYFVEFLDGTGERFHRDTVQVLAVARRVEFGPLDEDRPGVPMGTRLMNPGAVFSFRMAGADGTGEPLVVTLGSTVLAHAPGSDFSRVLVVVPGSTAPGEYTLTVTQGGRVSATSPVIVFAVEVPDGATLPYIDHAWFFETPAGAKFLDVVGVSLGTASTIRVNGNPVTVVSQDDAHAIVTVPASLDYFDTSQTLTVTVFRADGATGTFTRAARPDVGAPPILAWNGDFLVTSAVPAGPFFVFQDPGSKDWGQVVDAFCKALQDVINDVDNAKSEKDRKRIENFLKSIAAHESQQFTKRVMSRFL